MSQFSLWAVLASPLLVSFDVRNLSTGCRKLVTNTRAIAVTTQSVQVVVIYRCFLTADCK